MLFRKDVEPACALCAHAMALDGEDLLCRKKGVVRGDFRCARFRYDPTKRTPKPKLKVSGDYNFKIDD